MGNSIGPGHASMCVNSPGLLSSWDPERPPPSIFAPLRMVPQPEDGGASGPQKSSEEFIKEVKSSEVWKTFMKEFDDARDRMERGEGEVETEEEMISIKDEIDALSSGGAKDNNPEAKEARKLNLHKLKEKTGYSYSHCKKALENNNNDLEKAEKWLEQEGKELGLEKLNKIGNRQSMEGLVGIAWDRQHAAMVEVNSETDFVSSSAKFHELVDLVAKTCLQHTKINNPSPTALAEVMLKGDEMEKLVAEDKQTLSDHLSKTVTLLGERLRLRRAALISTEESSRLAMMTHGSESVSAEYKDQGRLGAVLVYKADDYPDHTHQLAKHICQHIIGMNPKSIDPVEGGSKETALLTQSYIRDSSNTVGELCMRSGIKVQHFVRFERGEPSDTPGDLGTEPAKPSC